jgi:IMP dehydrogenase
LPDETNLSTRLTSRITLNIPFVSARWTPSTEAGIGHRHGEARGIGVIHKNLPPEIQRSTSGA